MGNKITSQCNETEQYYGKHCPQGMVQVEFVGCDPKQRFSDYGYRPTVSAFIEVYVDGQRFRIDIGDIYNGSDSKKVRGIHINGVYDLQVERTASNAVSVFLPSSQSVEDAK